MNNSVKDKLKGFLEWYYDLYGPDWYVDNQEIFAKLVRGENKSGSTTMKKGMNAVTQLQKYRREIKDCPDCPLKETRTHFVFGDGNESADIMFIGEAPGRDEDLQGIPFVGRAGQLLNKLLAHIMLTRSDVYITNILKCRPPNNRDPLPEEVETCIPYLHRQIEIIQPKLLVALGRVAAQNLLNTGESLTKMRKKIWRYKNIPLFVTFHPAYILRNNNMLSTGVDDMKAIMDYYQKDLKGNEDVVKK